MTRPDISACICTHNGAERLGDSLWSLLAQSAPAARYEILVIDNASSDAERTRALVRDLALQGHPIDYVDEPRLGLAHAKNRAASCARGEYVYFLDDDAIANPRTIECLLEAITEHKPDILGGHVHPLFDELPPPELDQDQWSMWSLRHFGPRDRWLEQGEYFLGGNLCVRRTLLRAHPHDPELGRRGEELRGGEEWYLGDERFRRRLVTGAYIFHRIPKTRMQMEYVERVMCGPMKQFAGEHAPLSNVRHWPGRYLAQAWLHEFALTARRIAFQLRLALASRPRPCEQAASDPVLALLAREDPHFQLRTGHANLPSSERLFAERGGTDTRHFERASAALPKDSLAAVAALLGEDQHTIEIGGGQSTVVFASKVADHVCINPDRTANELVRSFLEEHDLWRDNVAFRGESSDAVLPGLDAPQGFDVALMDGNHSFPFPMLDWHFLDRHLRRGSFLVIDNVEINAVRMLTSYLDREPAYRRVRSVRGSHRYDCYVYEKLQDRVVAGWNDQAINRSTLASLCIDATVTAAWKPLQRLKRAIFGH